MILLKKKLFSEVPKNFGVHVTGSMNNSYRRLKK